VLNFELASNRPVKSTLTSHGIASDDDLLNKRLEWEIFLVGLLWSYLVDKKVRFHHKHLAFQKQRF